MGLILILCARSWGQLGNLNSASRLAQKLEAQKLENMQFLVQPIEDCCPLVAIAGEAMRSVTATSRTPKDRQRRYMEIIDDLNARFPAGFESDPAFVHDDIDLLASHIDVFNPDLIIATKGFLSRLAYAATRRLERTIPIVNFVTNDGLLTLPIHVTGPEVRNLVQTDFGKQMLKRHPRVSAVGPLVGVPRPVGEIAKSDLKPLICVLCNNNPEFSAIFDALIARGDSIGVKTIILGESEMLEQTRIRAPAHWDVWGAQAADAYLEILREVSKVARPLLVAKSSPNAVFEGLCGGMPVLAVRSGLPMEDWVGNLIDESGAGWSADGVATAVSILDRLLDAPGEIAERAKGAISFVSRNIDNQATLTRIRDTICAELDNSAKFRN